MPFLSHYFWPLDKTPVPSTKPAPIKKQTKDKSDYEHDFKKYYSKRYLEELKPYAKSPSYSISYMMLISSLPKIVKEKAQKEWDSNKLV